MTLIAITLNHGYPIIMGDVVFSCADSDGIIETPTHVNGIKVKSNSSKPSSLSQKMYVINDNLAVALGGRKDQMYTFLRKLRTFYSEPTFDSDELSDFIATYPIEDRSELIAVVLWALPGAGPSPNYELRLIGQFHHITNIYYQTVYAAGSGAEAFLEFIKTNPEFQTDITNEDVFLVRNQYLMSYWLGHETVYTTSLTNGWGVAFEMAWFKTGAFKKLQEYTVLLLAAKIGKSVGFAPAPFNTILVTYQDGVLIITAFANDIKKIFLAPAIDDDREEFIFRESTPNHDTLLATYIVLNIDDKTYYFPTVVFPRNKNKVNDTPFVFNLTDGKLQVLVDSRFNNSIGALLVEPS